MSYTTTWDEWWGYYHSLPDTYKEQAKDQFLKKIIAEASPGVRAEMLKAAPDDIKAMFSGTPTDVLVETEDGEVGIEADPESPAPALVSRSPTAEKIKREWEAMFGRKWDPAWLGRPGHRRRRHR